MGGPVDGHAPVLVREVCEALAPALGGTDSQERLFVDVTCGLAGHTEAVLEAYAPTSAIVFDRDADALERARARLKDAPCPVRFVHAPFSRLAKSLAGLGVARVAAILADLGVSSPQLDTAGRGFSWRADAPLDMRMDRSQGPTAAELLATIDAPALARILRDFGEEPDARRIARAIVEARPRTTFALAQVVADAMTARQRRRLGRRIHPATRTFLALRIQVNDELGELDQLLRDAPPLLDAGGRLAIITFHSLEDRRVKHAMRTLATPAQLPASVPLRAAELATPVFRIPRGYARGVTAGAAEIESNPRARSARVRLLERNPS